MFKERWPNGLGYDIVGRHGDEDVILAEVLDDPVQDVIRIRSAGEPKYLEMPRTMNILGEEVALHNDALKPETLVKLLDEIGEEVE